MTRPRVLRTAAEVQQWRAAEARPVAFIPTMGYLHEGHLALMREGRARVGPEGCVAISIFVNPTQFNDPKDLEVYPRDEEGDLDKAASVGVDIAFVPPNPADVFPESSRTWVDVADLDRHLCGGTRPGHFRGVCTVVCKLWNLVLPQVGVFGQKDFQQLTILRRMHTDLHLCGEIVGMPTVREPDGLAMSSRNARLDPQARALALAIPRFLKEVRARFDAGQRQVEALLSGAAEAMAPGRIDYASIVGADDLQPVATIDGPAVCAVAVHLGGVRLIDNVVLGAD